MAEFKTQQRVIHANNPRIWELGPIWLESFSKLLRAGFGTRILQHLRYDSCNLRPLSPIDSGGTSGATFFDAIVETTS